MEIYRKRSLKGAQVLSFLLPHVGLASIPSFLLGLFGLLGLLCLLEDEISLQQPTCMLVNFLIFVVLQFFNHRSYAYVAKLHSYQILRISLFGLFCTEHQRNFQSLEHLNDDLRIVASEETREISKDVEFDELQVYFFIIAFAHHTKANSDIESHLVAFAEEHFFHSLDYLLSFE